MSLCTISDMQDTYAIKNQTTSSSSKPPASLKRAKIWSTVSGSTCQLEKRQQGCFELTERLGNEEIGRGLSSIRAANEDGKRGSTRAI